MNESRQPNHHPCGWCPCHFPESAGGGFPIWRDHRQVAVRCSRTISQVVPRWGVSTSNPYAVCDQCGDSRSDHRADGKPVPPPSGEWCCECWSHERPLIREVFSLIQQGEFERAADLAGSDTEACRMVVESFNEAELRAAEGQQPIPRVES